LACRKANADRSMQLKAGLVGSVDVVRCLTRLVAQQMSAANKRLEGGRQLLKRCIPGWCPRNDHEIVARAYLAGKRTQHFSDSPFDQVPCHRFSSRPSYNDTDLWRTLVSAISAEQHHEWVCPAPMFSPYPREINSATEPVFCPHGSTK
jgi:hypothetical protein